MSDSVETPVSVEETPSAAVVQSDRSEDHKVPTSVGATKGPSELLKVSQSIKDRVNLNMSAWNVPSMRDHSKLKAVRSESAMSEDSAEAGDAVSPPDNSSWSDPMAATVRTATSVTLTITPGRSTPTTVG